MQNSNKITKGLASVIIPVYNREKMVKDAVLSVYEQNYRPIECILIDDGSTDNSVKRINQLKAKLESENFKVVLNEQKNAGAPTARNAGLKIANGEFIQFLDSDDLLYSDKLKAQILFLNEFNTYDAVYGDWHQGNEDGYTYVKGEKWESTLNQFYGGRVIANFSMLLSRKLVNKVGLWDESLRRNQEIDYFLRGVLAGGQFGYIAKPAGLWREHDGERIVTTSGALATLAFHDKWIDIFNKQDIFNNQLKKIAAQNLFLSAMKLESKHKQTALSYLHKAFKIYPQLREWNRNKMKILRFLFGYKLSINWWYSKVKS